MPAPAAILDLVARFGEHIDAYKSGSYNEKQLRTDYIDPLFEALGWDMNNKQGYAEAYRDVIHEDQVKVGGAVKAPDYGFYIGGNRKFFLEAKKPSVRIKDDISPGVTPGAPSSRSPSSATLRSSPSTMTRASSPCRAIPCPKPASSSAALTNTRSIGLTSFPLPLPDLLEANAGEVGHKGQREEGKITSARMETARMI